VVYETILTILIELHPQEHLNYKSMLMEHLQALGYNFPTYKVFSTIGPVHNILFFIGVYIENKLFATAYSSTKKEAEQLAAKKAIELLNI
jgi:ribonuclease-3